MDSTAMVCINITGLEYRMFVTSFYLVVCSGRGDD